ncbi:hypothetical protein WQ54_25625 [Bacillus sp. SA1-12]|nr:hypothetical protein WQ54_25625 [Bacillus sp. SA1-12]
MKKLKILHSNSSRQNGHKAFKQNVWEPFLLQQHEIVRVPFQIFSKNTHMYKSPMNMMEIKYVFKRGMERKQKISLLSIKKRCKW